MCVRARLDSTCEGPPLSRNHHPLLPSTRRIASRSALFPSSVLNLLLTKMHLKKKRGNERTRRGGGEEEEKEGVDCPVRRIEAKCCAAYSRQQPTHGCTRPVILPRTRMHRSHQRCKPFGTKLSLLPSFLHNYVPCLVSSPAPPAAAAPPSPSSRFRFFFFSFFCPLNFSPPVLYVQKRSI